MHRHIAMLTMGAGVLLLLAAGVLLLAEASPLYAQLPTDAEYVGARECSSCHRDLGRAHRESRHALALQPTGGESNPILADFTQGQDLRLVQFPGEDAPRTFAAADIAFAVGSGRHLQRYLYEVSEDEYAVFPAEWNTVEKTWQPYSLAEKWPDPAYDWYQNCAGCHTTGLDAEDGNWEDDGVQCESCHGPGSVHVDAADEAGGDLDAEELAAIRGAIVSSPDAQVCGQCHSQGAEPDQNRPYPVSYRPGDVLLDAGVYTLVAPDDSAHWRASGHAASQNMQYNEWLLSGHADALTTVKASSYADDSCLQCHSADYSFWQRQMASFDAGNREGDPPPPVTLETARFGVTCSTCHDVHGADEFGNTLVAEPYALCVDCHGDGDRLQEVHHPVQEMYEGWTVIENVSGIPSRHFTQGVECSTCHMPSTLQTGQTWYSGSHTMNPVLPGAVEEGQPDSCTGCHTDLTPTYMQEFVDKTQSEIFERMSNVTVAVSTAANPPDWTQSALEFVRRDGSLGVHNFSYAASLLDSVETELGLVEDTLIAGVSVREVEDPVDCAECHADEYRLWQTSPHANASLSDPFEQEFADRGRPSFCMRCHASGYDPRTETYVFEGVVCSNCHFTTGQSGHPPGPVEVADDSVVCGRCHSGEHAPTYDEWLVSSHSAAGIDCADCHTSHDNGLKLGDVNASCGSCHQEAMVDDIHMAEDMTCVDCHMARRTAAGGSPPDHQSRFGGEHVIQTGHTMLIDPGVCANCHGNIHLLSFGETKLSEQGQNEVASLRSEVSSLQDQASQNLNSGIVGGAIGALVLVGIVFIVVRLGRMR